MPKDILFWVIYLMCFLLGLWGYTGPTDGPWYRRSSGHLALWLLVGILGWQVFGPAVR
jgi:hypothetical protein